MVKRSQIIEVARTYLGVRYAYQGRTREIGLDCGGLLIVVGHDLKITDFDFLSYANSPDGETYERLLSENLDRIEPKEKIKTGDIIACQYRNPKTREYAGIQHTAFVTEVEPEIKVLHAKRMVGMVCEQRLYGKDLRGWCASYRVRGVEDE